MPKKPQGQYEIDWSNPLTKGLIIFNPFNRVAGDRAINYFRRDDKGYLGTPASQPDFTYSGSNNLTWQRGNVLLNQGAENEEGLYTNTGIDSVDLSVGFTYAIKAKIGVFVPQGSGLNTLLGYDDYTTNSININSSKQVWVYVRGTDTIISGTTLDDDFHTIILTYDGTTASVYVDGALISNPTAGAYREASAARIRVGFDGSSNRNLECEVEWLALYDRGISELEAIELSNNPYQILKEERTVQGATYAALFGSGVIIPDPDPLDIGLALGPTEYTQGSMYLGDTEIETMFLGGINITQQYVTDENGAYLIDENNNYITYGD